jgi:peptide chain release factor subunit 3
MSDLNSWEDDPAAQDENLSRQAQQQLNVNPAQAQGGFRPGVASFQPTAQTFQPGQGFGGGGGYMPQYQQQQYYQQGYYPQYGGQQQQQQQQQQQPQQGYNQFGQYGGGFSQGYNQGYGKENTPYSRGPEI